MSTLCQRPPPPSAEFLSDLEKVYATLPTASDANLLYLANCFDKWRTVTQEFVYTRRLDMSTNLSPKFLADLAEVYACSAAAPAVGGFLSDLEKVYATLPVASDATLLFLANCFDKWRT